MQDEPQATGKLLGLKPVETNAVRDIQLSLLDSMRLPVLSLDATETPGSLQQVEQHACLPR